LGWLKIAVIVTMLAGVAAGGFVLYGFFENGGDYALPVYAPEITYEEPPYEAEPLIKYEPAPAIYETETHYETEIYEEQPIDRRHFTIATRRPNVYRAPIVALTFDDGPVWLTEYLLDILDEYGGRVTFCVIGDLVEEGADIVIRAFEAGHEILGHSWDHANIALLSEEEIKAQILDTTAIIYETIGELPPPIFRVPFGIFNTRIHNAAYYLGYSVLNWSIDPADWRYRCEYHIYEYIMYNVSDGAIILLHDIHPTTIYAMRKVIPALVYQGFELVTATELIYEVYGRLEPGFEFTGVR
jgi:peptidoglycan/xylan/chitin deacetylase (PgdA/CDA1 family)